MSTDCGCMHEPLSRTVNSRGKIQAFCFFFGLVHEVEHCVLYGAQFLRSVRSNARASIGTKQSHQTRKAPRSSMIAAMAIRLTHMGAHFRRCSAMVLFARFSCGVSVCSNQQHLLKCCVMHRQHYGAMVAAADSRAEHHRDVVPSNTGEKLKGVKGPSPDMQRTDVKLAQQQPLEPEFGYRYEGASERREMCVL